MPDYKNKQVLVIGLGSGVTAGPRVGIGGGSMNEHHAVRGYRFRPLSADGCRCW